MPIAPLLRLRDLVICIRDARLVDITSCAQFGFDPVAVVVVVVDTVLASLHVVLVSLLVVSTDAGLFSYILGLLPLYAVSAPVLQ